MAAKKKAPAKRTTSGSGSSRAGEAARNGKGTTPGRSGTASTTRKNGNNMDVTLVNGKPTSYTEWDPATGRVKGRGKFPLK